MANPVYKIEVYDPTGPTLRHTIKSDVISLSITPRVTSGIGTFNFVLHRGAGINWTKFNDIAHYDDVYIWLDEGVLSTNPRMRGKITNINDSWSDRGILVQVSGKDYGEVLQRLLKTKYWESTQADAIIKEINDDAGLDSNYNHIEADATSLNYDAVDKPLIDILQDISEIRDKDWYVAYCYTHNAKELFWFTRQSATSTITLEEGVNIQQYRLLKDLNPIRNDITVYGAQLLTHPTDKDSKTESTDNWSDDGVGDTTITTNGDSVAGVYSINFSRINSNAVVMAHSVFGTGLSMKFPHEYRNLHFALKVPSAAGTELGTLTVRLRMLNTANFYRTILYPEMHNLKIGGDWKHFTLPVNREHEGSGANGEWSKTGTVDWADVDNIFFQLNFITSGTNVVRIDEMYYGEARVIGTASDATSQNNYGKRTMVVIDSDLSSSAASDYATYLLAQLKDPIVQLDILSKPELSLQVGDKVPIKIPSKSIDTTYDLLQVTHSLNNNQLSSRSLLSDRKQIRDITSFRDLSSMLASMTKRLEVGLRGKIIK